jgi:hypothetical protein
MKNYVGCALGLVVLILLSGCSDSTDIAKAPQASNTEQISDRYLLAAEPNGIVNVIAARESSKDNEEVVVVGRIGGGLKPFVESMAAFQIVDNSIKACSDDTQEGEDCGCPTPWDYCCETEKLPDSMAFVRFNDDQGNVHKLDAQSLFPVNELSTVVVKGVAKRDGAGNLTIFADGIYVRN